MNKTFVEMKGIRRKYGGILLFCICAFVLILSSCAKKPNRQELDRLEDARKAAESAEQKLERIRKERLELEEELAKQNKQLEKKKKEAEEAKSKVPE